MIFALLLAVLAAVGCSKAPVYTSFDWDSDVDFTRFKTYSWYTPESAPATSQDVKQAQQSNPLMRQRIEQTVDDALAKKGLQRVDSNPDMLVIFHTSTEDYQEIRTSQSYRDVWTDAQTTDVTSGTLVLDFINARTEIIAWRGIAEAALRADAKQDEINDLVTRALTELLKKYPPK